ncbi:MAG: thiol-disulfide oxidoreductase DCC family protein [Gaiellaceae bacterium]
MRRLERFLFAPGSAERLAALRIGLCAILAGRLAFGPYVELTGQPRELFRPICGFCRWSLGKILAWDRYGRLRPVALQDSEADALLPGMDPERKMASWHLVTPNGRVHSAGAAFPPLLRLLPGGRPLAAVAATFPGLTERGYR